ncbi:MAG: ribonucleotide-diphosphate reductase subunit alpha, partial [Bartonella sp.]|nr:ribonucleotide-diphosphate reductase subunit alpha [Bartonella sp.]
VSEASELETDLTYRAVGNDISCNLGSMNIAKAMESDNFGRTVEIAVRALTAVSDMSNIACVPSIAKGNAESHAIGLGQMNLHGFLAREKIYYGTPEAIDFTNIYFYTVTYHALRASNLIARERKEMFVGFEKSAYADGHF